MLRVLQIRANKTVHSKIIKPPQRNFHRKALDSSCTVGWYFAYNNSSADSTECVKYIHSRKMNIRDTFGGRGTIRKIPTDVQEESNIVFHTLRGVKIYTSHMCDVHV